MCCRPWWISLVNEAVAALEDVDSLGNHAIARLVRQIVPQTLQDFGGVVAVEVHEQLVALLGLRIDVGVAAH